MHSLSPYHESRTNFLSGLFFFLIFILFIFAIIGWIAYSFYSHKKQGLPPPSLKSWRTYVPFLKPSGSSTNYPTPRSSGPLEWIKDQIDKMRNKRTARGAYEETSGEGAGGYRSAGGRGGRGGSRSRRGWRRSLAAGAGPT